MHENDPFENLGGLVSHGSRNWIGQGADAGRYGNDDIHAIRVLATEPTSDPRATQEGRRRWWSASNERLRILGEIPVRKFKDGVQPIDPDGNPDTSFLAAIPADVAWTFQSVDADGMVLNMAQTWHQSRPGEVRFDCGGCDAHSQAPTPWEKTSASRADYDVFDLAARTPLLTSKKLDESNKQWDVADRSGLRWASAPTTVEYHRDVEPIFARSCNACHTAQWKEPAGALVLDDTTPMRVDRASEGEALDLPGSFVRLTSDPAGKFGHAPPVPNSGYRQASRYVRFFQSRRSLLVWNIFGRRTDGFRNDEFAYETVPGDRSSLQFGGEKIDPTEIARSRIGMPSINLAYLGEEMPPAAAVAGTCVGPDGEAIRIEPLSDEDRLTIVRWIDLGCPIDVDFDPVRNSGKERGWFAEDRRPTLTVARPDAGPNAELDRIVVGMHDFESGLDLDTFSVVCDQDLGSMSAGAELAAKFEATTPGVWEWRLGEGAKRIERGTLTVSVKDPQGNVSRVLRAFVVGSER